jgi:hypothetical protein
MLSDDQIERLMVSLEANTDRFDKAIAGSNKRLDTLLRQMEERCDGFAARIDKAMESAGEGVKRVMEGIGVGLTFEGLKSFVENVTETAMNVKKQSAAIGTSASNFQAWSILAKKADVDQEVFNMSLERMARNIGLAQLKLTPFGNLMQKYLGPDALKGNFDDVFYRITDFFQKVQSPTQREGLMNLITGGGGGSSAGLALAQFFGQGSASIKKQVKQLVGSGEVISDDDVEKIAKLDRAWIDVKATLSAGGASALTGFMDGFQGISNTVSDQRFQDGLRTTAKLLGEIVKTLGSNPKLVAMLGGAATGSFLGGLPGTLGGGLLGLIGSSVAMGQSPDQVRRRMAEIEDSPAFKHDPQLQAEVKRLRMLLPENAPEKGSRAIIGGADDPFEAMLKKPAGHGHPDLTDALVDSAYAKAVQSLKDRTAAMRDQTGEFANYTQAQEAARIKTTLLSAAEEDAARRSSKVTARQKQEIETLSQAYGKLSAAKGFDKDLSGDDDRIAKLKTEAAAAGATARMLAELQTREDLLERFHGRFGDKAQPTAAQMGDINAHAAAAGNAAADADFGRAVTGAQRQIAQARDASREIGLYGGKLAEAQMRMQLLTAATLAGKTIDQQTLQTISQLAAQYGQLGTASQKMTEAYSHAAQVSDTLRGGLENVAAAGLHGFTSMRSAAAGFLDQLAALVIKLYVVGPLLEDLFGPPGTSGGTLGNFINGNQDFFSQVFSMFGFANGGVMTPYGPRNLRRFAGGGVSTSAAIFGEAGPEAAVPLPDGRSIPVSLRMPPTPSIPANIAGPQVSVNYAPNIQIGPGADQNAVAQMRDLLANHQAQMPVLIHQTVTAMARRKSGPWN